MGRLGSGEDGRVRRSPDARRPKSRLLEAGTVMTFHKSTPCFRLDGGAARGPRLGEVGVADGVLAFLTPLLVEANPQFLTKV